MPEVMAFFPCERSIKRRDGSTDILNFGLQKLRFREKEEQEYVEAVINFHSIIKFFPSELGQKTLQIFLFSPDGERLSQSSALNFEIPEKGGTVNIGGEIKLRVKQSGTHELALTINEREEGSWPVEIEIIPQEE